MPSTTNGEPTRFEAFLRAIGLGYRRQQDFIEGITQSPESLPQALIAPVAIASASEYERLTRENRIREAHRYLEAALALTNHLYKNVGHDRVIFPQARMREGATEGGALGLVIDPNREYPTRGEVYYLLKRVDEARGRQVLVDSRHFQQNPNINLEYILSSIPIGDGHSYLWKRFVPGPDINNLFRTLDRGIATGTPTDRQLLMQLEKELKGIATRKLAYWQNNASDLLDIPKDPELVVLNYKGNFSKVLEGFMGLTDVTFTPEEKFGFIQALDNLNWGFMDDRKVVRNLAATYRNMIIATGKLNTNYPRFVELFTENGGRKKPNKYALERGLVFVDTPHKYSHPLEEAWEMDLSLEGGGSKRQAVRTLSELYGQQRVTFTQDETMLMGIYRAYRKAYLILTKFGPEIAKQLETNQIDRREYEDKMTRNRMYINHLLSQGQLLLQRWTSATTPTESMNTIADTLRKLSGYTTIDYNRPRPTQ